MREKHSREPSLAGVSFHSKKIHVAFPNWPLHARLCDPGGDSAATFREPGAARSGRRSGGDLPLSRHPPPSPASSFWRPSGFDQQARGGAKRPEGPTPPESAGLRPRRPALPGSDHVQRRVKREWGKLPGRPLPRAACRPRLPPSPG